MKTIDEIINDLGKILKEIKAGTINVEEAELLINMISTNVESYALESEYHESRGEKPPNNLPSGKKIKKAESMLDRTKREIEKKKLSR
jgi:type I restriction-modification system DNA methylase subunit